VWRHRRPGPSWRRVRAGGGGFPRARRRWEGHPRVFHATFLIVFFMRGDVRAGPGRSGSFGARTPPVSLRTQGGCPLRVQHRPGGGWRLSRCSLCGELGWMQAEPASPGLLLGRSRFLTWAPPRRIQLGRCGGIEDLFPTVAFFGRVRGSPARSKPQECRSWIFLTASRPRPAGGVRSLDTTMADGIYVLVRCSRASRAALASSTRCRLPAGRRSWRMARSASCPKPVSWHCRGRRRLRLQ
jgi:hypothetical protein